MIPDIHKTVIVTGASQGIGAGLVKAFLDRRYNVVATSRSITKTGGFKASDKLELVDGSIADLSTATRIVETGKRQFGAIDALVNNAGIYFSKAFTDYTVDDLRRLTSVNIEGFLFITQLVIKQMVAQKTNGCIVNITASLADHPIAGANSSVPMITKGGLQAISVHAYKECENAAAGISGGCSRWQNNRVTVPSVGVELVTKRLRIVQKLVFGPRAQCHLRDSA